MNEQYCNLTLSPDDSAKLSATIGAAIAAGIIPPSHRDRLAGIGRSIFPGGTYHSDGKKDHHPVADALMDLMVKMGGNDAPTEKKKAPCDVVSEALDKASKVVPFKKPEGNDGKG